MKCREWLDKIRWGIVCGEWPWKVQLLKEGEHLMPPHPWPDPPKTRPFNGERVAFIGKLGKPFKSE